MSKIKEMPKGKKREEILNETKPINNDYYRLTQILINLGKTIFFISDSLSTGES